MTIMLFASGISLETKVDVQRNTRNLTGRGRRERDLMRAQRLTYMIDLGWIFNLLPGKLGQPYTKTGSKR